MDVRVGLAPAAQTPELGPEPPPPSDATRRDPGRRGRERSNISGAQQGDSVIHTHIYYFSDYFALLIIARYGL